MRFLDALLAAKNNNKNIVIPDIKCFSPKEGDLMRGRNPVYYALALEAAGAPVVSVVTEEKEFHGSLDMLRDIAGSISVPILRKDFIHTREELVETKEAGASAILLMCSCLKKDELKYLYEEALKIGLDPFVETHIKEDFELVNELGAKLVGINNRDILVLERDDGDVGNTLKLAEYAPKDAFLVTESSIKNADQVRAAIDAGADAALVGTAILNARYTEAFYRMLQRKTSLKVCGLMNEADIEMCLRLGVDKLGIVCNYPIYVPWNLSVERAKELRSCIPEGYMACMVTGGSAEDIIDRCRMVKPDMVQLHYKENYTCLCGVVEYCDSNGIGVVKTVPINKDICIEQFGVDRVDDAIDMLNETRLSAFLVDPRHAENVTSKTLVLDTGLAKRIMGISKKPVILAGGLNQDNVYEVVKSTGAKAVDIMNGSEDEPGKKNEAKIKGIILELER